MWRRSFDAGMTLAKHIAAESDVGEWLGSMLYCKSQIAEEDEDAISIKNKVLEFWR